MALRQGVLYRLSVCAAMLVLAQGAFAAVLILEGPASPSAPPEASTLSPAPAPAQPAAPAQPELLPSTPAAGSPILEPANAPAPPASPASRAAVPPASPAIAAAPAPAGGFDTSKLPNPAEVSIEMMPGQTVSVGSRVSFRVSSKKAGYIVLIDVDPAGRLAQIYPNTASLARTSKANGNYIKPGGTMTIPLPGDPYTGAVQYVVSPPNGDAMIVAILSAQPVQILDLPDVPPDIKDRAGMLAFLSRWTGELRIPDDSSRLREAKWSFNAKPYTIQ